MESAVLLSTEIKTIYRTLNKYLKKYYSWDFVADDPIQIPHTYKKKQDIEISAFFASLFALGSRKVIIQKTEQFFDIMDNDPHLFILHFKEKDTLLFNHFKHRFFKPEDIIFLLHFLKKHYQKNDSLESAFIDKKNPDGDVYKALCYFHNYILKTPHHKRSEKHISTPATQSACKRFNLLLRWMVRKDTKNIDFGIWNFISPSQLIIPLDTHILNMCHRLNIIQHKKATWKTAVEITHFLQQIDKKDPIKYDFALMGMGLEGRIKKQSSIL